jgi:hypothetical protein
VFRTGQPVSAASVNETIQQVRSDRADTAIHPQERKRADRGKPR